MRGRPSGFTLIEVMMVVAVIGLLASVSIPTYQRFQLRSRQSERTTMLEAIRAAVEDYHVRQGRLPNDAGGATSTLSLQPNPNALVTPQKRPFRVTSAPGDHWGDLSLIVEGGVYYTYWGSGIMAGTSRDYWLNAEGDLDGDGVTNLLARRFLYDGTTLLRLAGTHSSKCSWESDLPAGGGVF